MTREQFQVLSVGVFPIVLTVGILTIPVVSDYSNHVLAEQNKQPVKQHGGSGAI